MKSSVSLVDSALQVVFLSAALLIAYSGFRKIANPRPAQFAITDGLRLPLARLVAYTVAVLEIIAGVGSKWPSASRTSATSSKTRRLSWRSLPRRAGPSRCLWAAPLSRSAWPLAPLSSSDSGRSRARGTPTGPRPRSARGTRRSERDRSRTPRACARVRPFGLPQRSGPTTCSNVIHLLRR